MSACPWVNTENAVRKAIVDLLNSPASKKYEDGSFGPLLVRLAWHASGTYSVADKTGGSDGATMRFAPENEWGANAGLHIGRQILEPVKKQFPSISYGDLWTLASVVAIEHMGGPKIAWKVGRTDAADGKKIVADGRLPDATKTHDHLREIFYRMGFNDRDIVALSGAHSIGRCHPDRSGFDGPWTFAPTRFSNLYFKELLNRKWTKKINANGSMQYEDESKKLMMLPSDIALRDDAEFRKFVDIYAKDKQTFFDDFSKAYGKLLNLGVNAFVCPGMAKAAAVKAKM